MSCGIGEVRIAIVGCELEVGLYTIKSSEDGSKRTMNLMSIACIIECIAFLSQQQPNLIHPRAKEIMEPDATVKI
jgi:hypothetical protein